MSITKKAVWIEPIKIVVVVTGSLTVEVGDGMGFSNGDERVRSKVGGVQDQS